MTTESKLKYVCEYKQHRRTVDPSFVEAERLSRKKYATLSKQARAFAKKYSQQFEAFILGIKF